MRTAGTQTEQELFLGCLHQEASTQKEVYERYAAKMHALCLRYIRDTAAAEDILITGFMKVFKRIHQFKGTGSFSGWIRKIMVNECLMYLEKEKYFSMEIGLENLFSPDILINPQTNLEVEDLMKLIDALPDGYRTVFNLYVIEGFSHQEIAEKLKISENTSKSQLCRARNYLQKMLQVASFPKNEMIFA